MYESSLILKLALLFYSANIEGEIITGIDTGKSEVM